MKKSKALPERIRFNFPDGTSEEMSIAEYEGHLARQLHELLTSDSPAYQRLGRELAQLQAARRLRTARGTGIGRVNLTKSNRERQERADRAALDAVRQWRDDPLRSAKYRSLPLDEVTLEYLRVGHPSRRCRDRLRALLGAGKIK